LLSFKYFRISITGYCLSSAYRLSQHRTVFGPAPSEAVSQPVAALQPSLTVSNPITFYLYPIVAYQLALQ
ncbi:hypothetical protein, partial [Sphingobacterium siyangense]|uniref:hypothetical protein n=1 Tax=Sphingobacterium siyangense TaxID=459529 RepID=UPI0028AB61C5